jgi:hypothetical protein
MKTFSAIVAAVGFLVLIGTAGADDFYHECLAAADCVAGEPMSGTELTLKMLLGVVLFAAGIFGCTDSGEKR